MSKHQQPKQQQSNQETVVQQLSVEQPMDQLATLRQRRMALVQTTLMQRRKAVKQQKFQNATSAYEQAQQALANAQAYQLALQQLQERYGITAPQQAAPRANSATTQPSATVITIDGVQYIPTKAVHKLCEKYNGVRKDVLAACKALNINPSTAATQYGVWKKQNPTQ